MDEGTQGRRGRRETERVTEGREREGRGRRKRREWEGDRKVKGRNGKERDM